ncbi:hypothetical protein TNIN_168591 [Trichonephila inaurata madagascariensis]|uniref:Uncharacterized protein n=1 Tax=Trichonephila inaurata madagascariensis TaxID=2747483 RepID=A0A8X7CP42_9ARAC|nr:hypothetical protein TNIN_168591 [Trichonephila inaurata madagascariensis]
MGPMRFKLNLPRIATPGLRPAINVFRNRFSLLKFCKWMITKYGWILLKGATGWFTPWTDESHFSLTCNVNSKNSEHWANSNQRHRAIACKHCSCGSGGSCGITSTLSTALLFIRQNYS